MKKISKKYRFLSGFTLIELLVVVSIMGILLSLSVYGMQDARKASRDGKRKTDLEQIRSALEMYKADCSGYPSSSLSPGGSLIGSGATSSCPSTNIYLSKIPADAQAPTRSYSYSSDGLTYSLCASLEKAPSPSMDVSGCGSCTTTCNYKVTSP